MARLGNSKVRTSHVALLIVLLCLPGLVSACSDADAGMNCMILGGGVAAAGGDCTCTGTGVWENGAVERFEQGTVDFCTYTHGTTDWTISEAGGGVVNTYSTTDTGDSCGHTMTIADDNAAAAETALIYASGMTGDGDCSVQFSFKTPSDLSWTNNQFIALYQGKEAGAARAQVRITYYDSQSGVIITYDIGAGLNYFTIGEGYSVLTTNTWYTILIDWNAGGTSTIYVYNGIGTTSSYGNESQSTPAGYDLDRHEFGILVDGLAVAQTPTITFENLVFTAAGL